MLAYHADVDQQQLRRDGDIPHTTLRAFGGEALKPATGIAPAAAAAVADAGAGDGRLFMHAPAHPHSPSATLGAGAATAHGGDGQSATSSGGGVSEDLWAREAALRDGFLRQVGWRAFGRDGGLRAHR